LLNSNYKIQGIGFCSVGIRNRYNNRQAETVKELPGIKHLIRHWQQSNIYKL